jgi:hypothetical protein
MEAVICDLTERLATIEAERDRLREALRDALNHLPDTVKDECWGWCWNELDGDSQDAVKDCRQRINAALGEGE